MQRYYPRTIEKILPLASARFKVVMLQGMRESGKSTVLMHLAGERNRVVLTVDDALVPEAKADPRGFFESLRAPAVVEGIDRVPELFRPLKSAADRSPERGQYWLTSSQRIELMTELEDKLPGRLLPLDLLPLSLAEREGRGLTQVPFLPDHTRALKPADEPHREVSLWEMMWQGAWPAVIDADGPARKAFYDALVAHYIERDVRPLVNLAKPDQFRAFLRALAMVSGEELRFNVISRLAGVDTTTVKRWLAVAERTGLIYLLPPFDGKVSRQVVKSPKLYLIDTGLLAHLLRIDSPRTMAEHPLAGKFFETFAVTEILKSWVHNGRTPDFYFFKESRGMEIPLLIRSGGTYCPVGITLKRHPLPADAKWILKLTRLGVKTGPAAVISTAPGAYAVAPEVVVQNVWSV